MKKSILRFKLFAALALLAFMGTSVSYGQATLMHSFTFEEGTYDASTVYDQTGYLNATIGGSNLTIADGKATVSGATVNSDGWLSMDGNALGLNTYTSGITLEAYLETGEVLNGGYTMLAYFGTATPGSGCFWIQPTRSGNETRLEANNTSTTVTAYKSDYEVDDGKMHHLVAILNSEYLTYWLDGSIIAQVETGGTDYISTIGTDVANLFRGVDGWNDPNYNASLEEFNIYSGTMENSTIVQRASDYLGILPTDARLDTIYATKGVFTPEFSTDVVEYELTIPYGATSVQLFAEPVVDGATITMYDGLGAEITDGMVTYDIEEGESVTIVVTALDGVSEETYIVDIWPGETGATAVLAGIDLSAGYLMSDFDIDSTSYMALIPYGTTTVDVTPVKAVEGQTVTGGGSIDVSSGSATTSIEVTSVDKTATKTYTVELVVSKVGVGESYYIISEASGTNMYTFTGDGPEGTSPTLQIPLKDEASQLWKLADSGVEGQYYLQNGNDKYLALRPIVGSANWNLDIRESLTVGLDSCRFVVDEFEPGRFIITSVERTNSSTPTKNMMSPNAVGLGDAVYSDKWLGSSWANDGLHIWNILPADEVVSPYDTYLEDITVDGVSLGAFDPATTMYSLLLPQGTSSITIGATAREAATTITGVGTYSITAPQDTITLVVTSTEDASYSTTYKIAYKMDVSLTLRHSYTFEDGTANDMVGDLDGAVQGGSVTAGVYSAAVEGDYITFDGPALAINTYASITVEAYVMAGDNAGWTMLSYFGAWGGYPSYWISIARQDDVSRTTVDAGNGAYYVNSTEPSPGENHHYVSILTDDSIFFYVDGTALAATATPANTTISGISNEIAMLCYGGYSDPSYLGDIYEFNIYEGQMDAATIADRAYDYPIETEATDATASAILADGDTIDLFASTTLSYVIDTFETGDATPVITALPKAISVDGKEQTITVTQATGIPGTATVEVTSADGSKTVTYTIAFDLQTAAKDVKADFIQVYPSVSDDIFTVSTDGKASTVSVYDLTGKMVMQKTSKGSNVIVDMPTAGMYIMKVESEGAENSFKVFKTK